MNLSLSLAMSSLTRLWYATRDALFAQFFKKAPVIETTDSVDYLRDSEGSGAIATPTIIWTADGTAKFEVTEADFPTLDFDQAVFSYVTSDEVGHTIVGTRSGGIYTAFPPIGNVSRLKLWDVREIPEKLGSELITDIRDREFTEDTGWWDDGGIWTIGNGVASVNGVTGSLTAGTIVANGVIYVNTFDVVSINSGTVQIYGIGRYAEFTTIGSKKTVFTSDGTLFRYRSNLFDGSIDNVSVKEIQLTQSDILDLNLDGNQVGVVAQFGFEEGAGEGTNVTVFDRLNDNVFGTIIDNATGATWGEDSTILSVNHALGFGVSDETAYGNEIIPQPLDFTSNWVEAGAATVDDSNSYTTSGIGGVHLANIITIGTTYITTIDGTTTTSGIAIHNSLSSSNIILTGFGTAVFTAVGTLYYYRHTNAGVTDITVASLKLALEDGVIIPISTTNPTQTVLGTTPDYLGKSGYSPALVNQNCVVTTGTEYLQLSENVIDGNKWAFEIDLDDVDVTHKYNILIGNNSSTDYLSLRNNTVNVLRILGAGVGISGTEDTSVILGGTLTVVSNSSNVKIYHNYILFDTISFSSNMLVNRILNWQTDINDFGAASKSNNFKIADLSAYTSGEIDAFTSETMPWTNWFALNEYDNNLTIPTTPIFYCKLESGVTATLTNGTDANIGKASNASGNMIYGYNLGQQYLYYSNQFDNSSIWGLGNTAGLLTPNYALAPNGQMEAFLFDTLVVDGAHYLIQTQTLETELFTFSVYFKYVNCQWVALRLYSQVFPTVYFDILNGVLGTVSSGGSGAIEDIGDGWYKCSAELVGANVVGNILCTPVLGDNTTKTFQANNEQVLIWRGDLKRSDAPEVYYETTEELYLAGTNIPASAITPTKDIAGVDLINLPNNSTNENNLLYPEVAELIDRGDGFTGVEKVVNGGFDTDTDWDSNGPVISNGKAVFNGTNYAYIKPKVDILELGEYYEIIFDVALNSGQVRVRCGTGTNGTTRTETGTYTEILQCTINEEFYVQAVSPGLDGTIDNVSIRKYYPLFTAGTANPIPLNQIDGGSELVTVEKEDGTNISNIEFSNE